MEAALQTEALLIIAAAWFTMGIFALVVCLMTWPEKPKFWLWPFIIVFWPTAWLTDGTNRPQ